MIVITVSAAPTFTADGCTAVKVGAEPETIRESAFVVVGDTFESKTVRVAVPGCARRLAETWAVIDCVTVFTWTLEMPVEAPFQRTVEFAVNPRPFNVNVIALPPAGAKIGLIPLSANDDVPVSDGSE